MSTSRSRKAKTKLGKVPVPVQELTAEISRLSRARPASTTTLAAILHKLQERLGADALSIYQFDSADERLSELVSVGVPVELTGFLAIGQGQGLTGWAALHTKPLVLKNRTSNTAYNPDHDYASFLAAPLPPGSAPVGLLAVGCKRPDVMGDEESEFVSQVADAVSTALERYLFCRRLEHAGKEIDRINRHVSELAGQAAAGRELGETAPRLVELNHEINEALSVIIGHVQCLVADRAMTNQKEMSRLRRMEEAAVRIRAVNKQLLKLARAGQSRQAALNPR